MQPATPMKTRTGVPTSTRLTTSPPAVNKPTTARRLERADSAGAECPAIHHGRVELHLAEQIGPAATADGADRLVAFDQPDAGLHRVERGSALGELPRRFADARRAFIIGDEDHSCSSMSAADNERIA